MCTKSGNIGTYGSDVKLQSERLDWLVAFTHTMHECDAWMYVDPEAADDDITSMVKSLAGAWRRLLNKERNTKADLGWDQQHTKPGVLELLLQFKAKVEACPALKTHLTYPRNSIHDGTLLGMVTQITTMT